MKISMWKRFSCALAVVALAAMAVAAKDVRNISVRDDCDATTFNAVIGEGTCVGDGDTTFDEFVAELPDGHEKWRFNNDRTETDAAVNATNRGGEVHSFTEVGKFGGGFIPFLNNPDEDLAPECVLLDANGEAVPADEVSSVPGPGFNPNTIVPPGKTSPTQTLTKGTHKFQCCIHPWMRSVVTRK